MTIDLQAVSMAKAGSVESFSLIYEQVKDELYKYALYTLGNSHDAEDAVADTFVEAFKGISNLRDEAAFKSWIFRILSVRMKRKISDIIRRKNTVNIDDFLGDFVAETDIERETSDKVVVLGALGRLSNDERMIVVLSAVQGYTTKEIAEMLGCPQGTISSKLHRSLIKMRKMIEVG
ncbi:MAG: RNA polymerase sigma factor [Hydrogenoanaerobacterium sp.]